MRFNIIIRSILNFKNTSEISVASGVYTVPFFKIRSKDDIEAIIAGNASIS